MFKLLPLSAAAVLALGLAACGSSSTTSKREEHHYALSKPSAEPAQSGVAPVVATAQPGKKGPADTAHTVYFDFDSYTVRPADRPVLESHARWTRSHPGQSLTLQGHTDARGGIEYNLALGQKRAESVRSSLQTLGVDPARVEAVSYGKERLADTGSSEEAHQRNRRVEFEYR
jgi:peptidoglycan-associated lipoprotein